MIKYLLFIFYTIGGICNPLKNRALPKTNREFCLYTSNSMLKMFNPFYINSQNETVYFDNVEEYAKFVGPTWSGVGICGENTIVNNVGEYFTVFKSDKLDKRSEKESDQKDKEDEKANKFGKEEESIFKSNDLKDYKKYYKDLIDGLIFNRTNVVSLTSENPALNPYHPLLIHAKKI